MSATGFTREQVAYILLRDGERCCLCGARATVANHRMNRGAGGRESLNRIDNGCALCWTCNDLIERDWLAAEEARRLGIKLRDGDPFTTPLWSPFYQLWIILHPMHTDLTHYTDRDTRPDVLL